MVNDEDIDNYSVLRFFMMPGLYEDFVTLVFKDVIQPIVDEKLKNLEKENKDIKKMVLILL